MSPRRSPWKRASRPTSTWSGTATSARSPPARPDELFTRTQDFWRAGSAQSQVHGPLARDRCTAPRSRSSCSSTTRPGALIAAPTTSLPEEPGGTRNWDYRYAWLRDASFTVYSLMRLGFLEEAASFMDWLQKRCETATAERDVIDHVHRRRQRPPPRGRRSITWRATTAHGRCRIGNGAVGQRQLDVYGEIMDSVYLYNKEAPISYDLWTGLSKRLDWLSSHWTEADEGIWEIRGPRQRFTYSALMTWVAYDRARRLADDRPSYNMMADCDTLLTVGSNFPYTQFLPELGQARAVQIDRSGSGSACATRTK